MCLIVEIAKCEECPWQLPCTVAEHAFNVRDAVDDQIAVIVKCLLGLTERQDQINAYVCMPAGIIGVTCV